jgi:diguanylate cyclase (GGDEF)-like protein/PAS domain S-box-containing protein
MVIKDSWLLNALLENTGDSIYIKDKECRLWRVSRKMAIDLGFKNPEEIYGKTDIDLFGEEFGCKTMIDDRQVMVTGQPKLGLVEKYLDKNGETNWTSTTKMPLRNEEGQIVGLLGITREINDLKNSEMSFQWLATHDPLTSLANRFLLMDRIEQAANHAKRNRCIFSLLFIDLDGFKKVNDLQGHAKGDHYLKKLAKLLTRSVRSSDTVARIGGDEFVILLDGITHPQEAETVASKLTEIIRKDIDTEEHSVTASIGVSTFPEDGANPESLLKAADQAMYVIKKKLKEE